MKKTIVLFDMDGTIIDSTNAIYESFSKVFYDNKMPHISKEEVTRLIGYTLQDMFLFLGVKYDDIERFCNEYKAHYTTICNTSTKLLPNILEAIKLAHSFAFLGVVTTKTSRSSREILRHFKLDNYFTTIIGREDVVHTKPNKEPIMNAIKAIELALGKQFDGENIFMIGDTILDLKASLSAKVNGIGVLCGYGLREDLKKYSNNVLMDTLSAVQFIKSRQSK